MIPDDLQLPSGEPVQCPMCQRGEPCKDNETLLRDELRELKEFVEYFCEPWFSETKPYGHWHWWKDGKRIESLGSSAFEAWQNAKEAGKL